MMVPSGMAAYARILNPVDAFRLDDDQEATWRWADVAARNNVTLDSASEWLDITLDDTANAWPDGWQVRWPDEGRIDPALLASFVPALRAHTTRPDDITLAVWEGWGFGASSVSVYVAFDGEKNPASEPVTDPREPRHQAIDPRLVAMAEFDGGAYKRARRGEVREFGEPRFDLPHRRYALGATNLDELARPDWPRRAGLGWAPDDETGIMPQLIWPADETWCLSIEVDAPYTVVAGPRELVRELLTLDGIEGHSIREPRYT